MPFSTICRLDPTAAKRAWLLAAPIVIWHAELFACHVPLESVTAVHDASVPSLKYATSFENAIVGIDVSTTTPASADNRNTAACSSAAPTRRASPARTDVLRLPLAEHCSLTTTHASRTRSNTTRKIRFMTTSLYLPPHPVSGARRRPINDQRSKIPDYPANPHGNPGSACRSRWQDDSRKRLETQSAVADLDERRLISNKS